MRGLLGLPVEFGEHRNLDRTCLREDFVRANQQLLPACQIKDCNTEHAVESPLNVAYRRAQLVPEHLLLPSGRGRRLGNSSDEQTGNEHQFTHRSLHSISPRYVNIEA